MKKTKTLVSILLLFMIGVGITIVFFMSGFFTRDNTEIPSSDTTPEVEIDDQNEKDKEIDIDLVEYQTYQLEGLDFGVVIAKIRIQNETQENLDMKDLITSEDLSLANVELYVNQMREHDYYLVNHNVQFDLQIEDNPSMIQIFIPYKDLNQDKLVLKSLSTNDEFTFDLSHPIKDAKEFYYKSDDVITDGESFEMVVSEAFKITGDEITRTYDNGYSEVYQYPSTAEVYAFKVSAVSLDQKSVEIADAMYEVEGTGDVFIALNKQFKSMKYDNIIGKEIFEEGTGTLLFMALNPEKEDIKYTGRLKIKLVGSEEWISIYVDL